MKKGFVYILRGLKNNKLYIGSTTEINRRVNQHEIGSVKATRPLRPIKLEFFQEYDNINLARKIEHKLKKFKRKDFLEKIIKDGFIKMGP
ncbi:MAG: GIY-YIG nuclease family protein [Candidatus Omnitrophota bacterium]|nr:GIY-YIG nuclease family protein [Candidatus Omnitrophota bacterium]